MHFGYDMDEPRIASGQYHLHIPIRNPVEVARSWGRRGKNMDRMLEAYQSMFRHMENIPHTCHKMEDIEPLAGIKDSDRDTIKDESRLDEYEGKVLLEVVLPHLDFFKRYYGG